MSLDVSTERHRAPYSGEPLTHFTAEPGELVVLRNWKWDGRPHWAVPSFYLGSDEYGHWLYQPAGHLISRPGFAFLAHRENLVLFPHDDQWVATFHTGGHEHGLWIYVDLVTDNRWQRLARDGWEINLVDMDLDVLRFDDGRMVLDDEDEFEDHQKLFHYPQAMIDSIAADAERIYRQVEAGDAPFDHRDQQWLKRAQELGLDRFPGKDER
ncbi:DUF402 domain-containing protein [Haematomicrobium sanguinis]|uniref:DUF402 domain-containing protein n=1 Tax=Haematomicrobium sanguinis TaxID=479106 RepID=UPI000A008E27|nr:DUF402 domain-containing protein [Haematomicrobium sanguinis]